MKEAELLILSAETVSHGREIAYEVKLEAGDVVSHKIGVGSLFVDSWLTARLECFALALANMC